MRKTLLFSVLALGLSLSIASAATKKTTAKAPAKATAKPAAAASSGRASIGDRTANPYLGAIAIDAASGTVLVEDKADAQGYPASVLKLMDMLVILDRVKQGSVKLEDTVHVTAEASKTGGSQVYLKEGESFTVDELLYALMVQSANDAAVALAIHVAGSKEGFVELMNAKAREIGMKNTVYHSVHGLPPSAGQDVDVSTPRDLSTLARELITKYPEILRYTSTKARSFRNGTFNMANHNHLLETFPGCDGMKTGYIKAGGYSSVVTATRNDRRVIAVVLGSMAATVDLGKLRDAKAKELLNRAFAVPAPAAPKPPVAMPPATSAVPAAVAVPATTAAPAAPR